MLDIMQACRHACKNILSILSGADCRELCAQQSPALLLHGSTACSNVWIPTRGSSHLPADKCGLSPQQVSSYSFVFPSVPGDESWPELRGRPVRFLVPLLDLLNHAADPNVAIQRSSDGAERAFIAKALRHIRWDEQRAPSAGSLCPCCCPWLAGGVHVHEAEARLPGALHRGEPPILRYV